jgi:hypothetical protein
MFEFNPSSPLLSLVTFYHARNFETHLAPIPILALTFFLPIKQLFSFTLVEFFIKCNYRLYFCEEINPY